MDKERMQTQKARLNEDTVEPDVQVCLESAVIEGRFRRIEVQDVSEFSMFSWQWYCVLGWEVVPKAFEHAVSSERCTPKSGEEFWKSARQLTQTFRFLTFQYFSAYCTSITVQVYNK